jgi:hypothetical protein
MLAYYRKERIVEDIGEFAKFILFSESIYATKRENYHYFKAMFEPNGVVKLALAAMHQS